jgi:hypothetical protein
VVAKLSMPVISQTRMFPTSTATTVQWDSDSVPMTPFPPYEALSIANTLLVNAQKSVLGTPIPAQDSASATQVPSKGRL